jgi:hypothetical protein
MTEPDQLNYLMDRFQRKVLDQNFFQCRIILNELKRCKKYYSTENFKIMNILIDFIEKDIPIYLQQRDFERVPLIYLQLSVLENLEQGLDDKALLIWNKLKEKFPFIYQDNFRYSGDEGLFKMALNKLIPKQININKKTLEGLPVKDRILRILEKSQDYISQDLLFELVWDRKAIDKNDYQLLAKNIYKVKKKYNLKIVSRRKCYLLKAS